MLCCAALCHTALSCLAVVGYPLCCVILGCTVIISSAVLCCDIVSLNVVHCVVLFYGATLYCHIAVATCYAVLRCSLAVSHNESAGYFILAVPPC